MITVPILCYHKVGPEAKYGRRLNIEPARLASHLSFFSRRGYRTLVGKDFLEPLQSKCVAFTFDDAFECTVSEVNVIFGRFEASATHYAVAEKVGVSSDWEGESPFPLAGWNLLQEAARLGHEIGNHTCRHMKLGALDPIAIEREISDAETILTLKGLGGSFCYPYGSFNAKSSAEIGRTPVPVGMSLLKGLAREDSNRLLLPRVTVAFSDALPMLIYKVFLRNHLRRPPKIVLNS